MTPAAENPSTLRGTLVALALTLGAAGVAHGQQPPAAGVPGDTSAARTTPVTLPTPAVVLSGGAPVIRLSLAQFMAEVGRRNLDYAAQAFNVPIADAQVSVARLFPNPSLDWAGSFDVSGQHQASTYAITLSQTILLGGKLHARTRVASEQLAAARAQLDDFLRTLRGTAATAYVDAVHAEQVYERKRKTAEDLDRLVTLNERRVKVGDIGEIDLAQSRVDAAQFHGELISAANEVHTARLALTGLLNPRATDTLIAPAASGELVRLTGMPPDAPITQAALQAAGAIGVVTDTLPGGLRGPALPISLPGAPAAQAGGQPEVPNLDSLTRIAVASRPDVIAARRLLNAANAGVQVARGDRWSDIDLSVGTSFFTQGTNIIDPTPKFTSLLVGLSFPIPLSNLSHGEVRAAEYTAKQAQKTEQSTEWKAVIDVRTSWSAYQAAIVQLSQYTSVVLLDAERVRRAKLYSYQHGSASLLDVLAAEQAANDVYTASYDAQQQYAHALINLGQSTGTWSLVYKEEAQ
jgi:cobalt-zinc-cadmium efflux system outer membrane protein